MSVREARTQLMATLLDKDPDLAHNLPRSGGLRALFDTASAEWKSTTIEQKLDTIRRLMAAGYSIERLEYAFVEEMGAFSYDPDESRREFGTGTARLLDALLQLTPPKAKRRVAKKR